MHPNNESKVLIRVSCKPLGDTICSTPSIRKAAKAYGHKIDVMTHRPDVFQGNPYVEKILEYQEEIPEGYKEVFETYNHGFETKTNRVDIKLHNFEARQLHAMGLGVYLYPEEMEYDYFPSEEKDLTKEINKDWIILHTTSSWPNRTWEEKNWERLATLIKNLTDFKIAVIGKSHEEPTYNGSIQKSPVSLSDLADMDLRDSGDLNDLYHTINNSHALVSFDSGPIHVAGCTDSWVIQIGSSVDWRKTQPYRKGRQDYKFKFVGGDCKLFCASDPKYSVREWGTINSMPYVPECLEGYSKFKCQPTPDQVFHEILKTKTYE